MTRIRTILITMAAAGALSLAAATSSYAAVLGRNADCLSDQQVQTAIESGEILSWAKIRKLARISSDYREIGNIRVCRVDGVLYYTVNLLSSYGEATKIVVNAVDGTS